MAKVLTAKAVEHAKPGAKRHEIPDGGCRGLRLVVQPSGAKSWCVRYRFAARQVKLTLGTVLVLRSADKEPEAPAIGGALTLAAARKLAADVLHQLRQGRDPAAEKQADRRARRQQAAAASAAAADTVDAIAERFLEQYAKRHTREVTWRETARILGFKPDPDDPKKLVRSENGGEVLRKWSGLPIHDITRRDVIELLDAIADRGLKNGRKGIVANRVLAVVSKLFSWASSKAIVETSPCVSIGRSVPETTRDRVLSDSEIRTIWAACDLVGWPYGPMVRLLLLTAQRRNEVAGMRWQEVDLEVKTWTLPRERVKNDREHVVPLSNAALAVLSPLPRIGSDRGFILTATGENPVSAFSRAKLRMDAAIVALAGEPLAPWSFHDLRRSAASNMARLGIQLPVIEKVLNHTSGSFRGVVGVYQRHHFADEKRAALEAWGRFIEQLVTGEPTGNVVALRP